MEKLRKGLKTDEVLDVVDIITLTYINDVKHSVRDTTSKFTPALAEDLMLKLMVRILFGSE